MGQFEIRAAADRIAAFILYAALAAPPFLFGAREPTSIAFWCAVLGLGLILASTRRLRGPHIAVLLGLAFVALCFGFVLHEQLSDHPWIAEYNPIWAKASEALGQPIQPSVSIVRGEPYFALGPSLANTLALILGLLVGVDRDRARQGLRVMAWAGVGYAVYGILALLIDPTMILWREKTAYVGNLTATFVNRNTAAVYFGSCSVLWLIRLLQATRRRLPPGDVEWGSVPQTILTDPGRDVIIRFIMLAICLLAMFATSSRGGVLCSLLAMVITFLIYVRRDIPSGKGLLIACVCAGLVSIFLLQVMGSNVLGRINLSGLSDEGRLSAWRSTLRIISDNPWFGTGLGTFAWSFPSYRSNEMSMWGVWDIAHNTYLEFASELGIPLAILVALAWIVAIVILVRGLGGRRRGPVLAALMVSLIALLHSSIDFSLQIAGYSIVVFALLGLGLGQSLRTDQIPGGPVEKRGRAGGRPAINAGQPD
jgi:O-antigen ligase